jgi:FixJ family two-component response regulator
MLRPSIAIVDDDESVRISLWRLCELLDMDARMYGTGREFIESLLTGSAPPDCLLLDAHMPAMTGLEVQEYLVNRGTRLPTVVYTADDTPEAQARHIAAGATEYLQKPIGADELLSAVRRALACWRPAAG